MSIKPSYKVSAEKIQKRRRVLTKLDPIYRSLVFKKFSNNLMRKGNSPFVEKLMWNWAKKKYIGSRGRYFNVLRILIKIHPTLLLKEQKHRRYIKYTPFYIKPLKQLKTALSWLNASIQDQRARKLVDRIDAEFKAVLVTSNSKIFGHLENIERITLKNKANLRWKRK